MLPTRDSPQNRRPTQTERKGQKTIFQATGQGKSQCSNTYIRQNRLQNKGQKKRHRRTLHNTQWKNLSRRQKNCKHICTQQRSTQTYKENLRGLQENLDRNTLILGKFNSPLSKMDRSSKQNINKDIAALNNGLNQMDLTDMYIETFFRKKQNTFFSNAHGTFLRQTT